MGVSQPVKGLCDVPMWESMERRRLELQACSECEAFRYPPAPICPRCLSPDAEWRPVSGGGVVLSWVVFHRKYFDDFPPPYNAVAVRLDEGPIIVTNLVGNEPEGEWIGRRVVLEHVEHEGRVQHAARLADED